MEKIFLNIDNYFDSKTIIVLFPREILESNKLPNKETEDRELHSTFRGRL